MSRTIYLYILLNPHWTFLAFFFKWTKIWIVIQSENIVWQEQSKISCLMLQELKLSLNHLDFVLKSCRVFNDWIFFWSFRFVAFFWNQSWCSGLLGKPNSDSQSPSKPENLEEPRWKKQLQDVKQHKLSCFSGCSSRAGFLVQTLPDWKISEVMNRLWKTCWWY